MTDTGTTAPPATARADVAVIILTYNEEANIAQALASVCGWAREVFIVDSYSTDRTLDIARQFDCQIVQHAFNNYSTQRNYALDELPIHSAWVLFLDADEWLPDDLKSEIAGVLSGSPEVDGFVLSRRLIWMGAWIKRGYYPTWILRLFRRGKGRCEDREVNEHLVVEGTTARLTHDFMHEDRKGVTEWIAKHNAYATLEARTMLIRSPDEPYREIDARLFGTQAQAKRWLRHRVWGRLPLLIRPFLFFFYRYVLRGGILDGRQAFIYHFLQALWFPFLVDVKYLEMKMKKD